MELVPFPVKFVWSAFPFGNIEWLASAGKSQAHGAGSFLSSTTRVELVPFPVKFVWSAFPFGNIEWLASAGKSQAHGAGSLPTLNNTSGTRALPGKICLERVSFWEY